MPRRDQSPAAVPLVDALGRVSTRLRTVQWARAAGIVAVAAALTFVAAIWLGTDERVAALLAAAVAAATLARQLATRSALWTWAAAAAAMERAEPSSRNVIVTAEELLRHPERASARVQERVFEHASRIGGQLSLTSVAPLQRPAAAAAAAVALAAIVVAAAPRPGSSKDATGAGTASGDAPGTAPAATLSVTIVPPPYTGEAARTIENPDRLEGLEGSRVQIALRDTRGWRVRFGAQPLATRQFDQSVGADLILAESGYLAIEPEDGSADRRRLVPVVVIKDRAPAIRIEAPGKDLLVTDAKRVVAVSASAADDYGLASLDLRYTRISGSGENFEFQEGTIPLRVARANDRAWTADAELSLARLGLAPGDSLVYRIVGRDRRPGEAGTASSDTFFVEVAGPGQVALEGFELPPDRERYALSQQMIVLKLERLRARERSLERTALEQEMATLAAEQRAVRANFIFLTGGTVEDEEEEAEHSHEIQEGRLANTARADIMRAIQHMTRAEQGLAAVNTGAALPPAKAAVEALQRAFGRNRYFLRTVPVRSRVDPSRRLSGDLTKAADWRRELFPPGQNDMTAKGQTLLARLIEWSPQIADGTMPPAALTALAEEAMSIDTASAEWQTIARRLIQLRDANARSADDRRKLVGQSAGAIAGLLSKQASGASSRDASADRLRGAWQDARERK